MSHKAVPCGEWASPLSGDTYAAQAISLSQVRVDGHDTYWVETRATEDARNVLLYRNALGQTQEVLPQIDGVRLPDVRSQVYEYGGRAYAVSGGRVVFSDGTDERVYLFDRNSPSHGLVALTPLGRQRFGDFSIDTVRGVALAVRENHEAEGYPTHDLVTIPLDGSAGRDGSAIHTIFSDSDFIVDPTLSPDGTKIAWITWEHPNMPWDKSVLHVANIDDKAQLSAQTRLIDLPNVSVSEPRWTLDGDLVHVDDSSGWANLYRTEGFEAQSDDEASDAWTTRLRTRTLHPGQHSFSMPHWQLGLHGYDNFDHDQLICSWTANRERHIGTIRLDNGLAEEWHTGWWPMGNVASAERRVVFLADSATHTPAIIEIRDGRLNVIRTSTGADFDEAVISPARLISWQGPSGEWTDGYLYTPKNPVYEVPDSELPPLIVYAHDGPTSASHPGLRAGIQYFTSRGFTILDVNYRGSIGRGRAYRDSLNGHWGVYDVEDCVSGAQHLIDQGLVDPKRVAIHGRSAGGFTALSAIEQSDLFSAATVVNGISDLRDLAQNTHKFENNYAQRLLGSYDFTDAVWQERSPITHVDKINVPILLNHGGKNRVVPVEQSQKLYEALLAAGKQAALLIAPDEGKVYKRGTNIARGWASELSFYGKVWGFTPDEIIDIEFGSAQ